MNYQTALEIEVALATRFFNYRMDLVVPNISWGLGIHECDLLVAKKSGYATEVEIKISKADLIKDKDKSHGHKSNKIKYLYFAIPSKLAKHIEHIPMHAGIIVVTSMGRCMKIAEAKANPGARKLSADEMFKVARLGALRIWNLKDDKMNLKNLVLKLKSEVQS